MKLNPAQKTFGYISCLFLIAILLSGLLGLGITKPLSTAAAEISKIYVTNCVGNTIIRANLDGTGGENLGNLNGTLSTRGILH